MATTKKDEAAGGAQALRVVARSDSFRRAGHAFGAEAKTIPLAELTREQIHAICNDSMLVVSYVALPQAGDAPAEK